MKEAGHVRWLRGELAELVAQRVIPAEAADRLRLHYGDPDMAGSPEKRWAIILFSILGAALIGGGMILLLAHNWEGLSRPARAIFSIAPLAITVTLGAWLLWTERESIAWREGVATAQTLAIGASIALVSQTYNLGGQFDEYMLSWSLLALPIAYLLRATMPMLLYLVGITVWTGSVSGQAGVGLWYYPLLAAALPFVWWSSRSNRYHPRTAVLWWVLAITICIGAGLSGENVYDRLKATPVLLGGLFAVSYLVGVRWWSEAVAAWQRPLQTVGALGAVCLALFLSFANRWSHPSWSFGGEYVRSLIGLLQLAAAAIFPIAGMVLWVRSWKRQSWVNILVGSISVLTVVAWIPVMREAKVLSAVLFNLYLFVLGIGMLVTGLRSRKLGTVNVGMVVLAAVILCRFFDGDLSFLARGMAFIMIGIGFLVTNLMLRRRKDEVNR